MRVLSKFLREYGSAHFRALLVMSVVTNLMVLAPSFHMLQVYDRVLAAGSGATLFYITVIAVFALCIYGVAEAVRLRIASRLSSAYSVLVSQKLFARFAQLPQGSGGAGKYLRDYSTVRTFLSGKVLVGLFDLPFIPLFLVLLYFVHPTVALLTLLGIGVMIAIGYLNHSLSDPVRAKSRQADADATGFAQAAFSRAEDVRALGLLPTFINVWGQKSATALKAGDWANAKSGSLYALGKAFRQILQVLIMAWGAWLVLTGDMSGGMIFMASMISGKALGPIEQVIGGWEQITKAVEAFDGIEELTGPNKSIQRRQPLPQPRAFLRAEALTVTADGRPDGKRVLDNVSFEARPGELIVIVGPVGAGKSLLSRLLAGAFDPTSGRITLESAPRDLFSAEQWGGLIGYLGDETSLFPGTVATNICRFNTSVDPETLYRAAKAVGAHDMILQLPKGYNTAIGDGTAMLSSGQRQLIGLARAFYGNPKVIILDNPGSFIDQMAEQQLFNGLTEARRGGACAVVFAKPGPILNLADRAFMLQGGRLQPIELQRQPQAQQRPPVGAPPIVGPNQPVAPIAAGAA